MFEFPKYVYPDFCSEKFQNFPNAILVPSEKDGVVPDNFHATTIYPTFVKINNEWKLIKKTRMDCVIVVKDDEPFALEFRNIKKGDLVVTGRSETGEDGVYIDFDAFLNSEGDVLDKFAFRQGRSRESAYSQDYDRLYDILRHDKEKGNILWVMGPATIFDYDSRKAFASLVNNGFVDGVLAGNAFGTHDLEGSFFHTALGQDIYTKQSMPNGHYNHIEVLNRVRRAGSVKEFIRENNINDGVVAALEKNNIPYVLAGSIRDDGPLPCVYSDVYKAQDAMRNLVKKATTVIALATQLHTIATGNMTPSYFYEDDGTIRPTFFYTIDISEFAVNKLRDRGSLSVNTIVTNVQDFIVNLERNLVK